MFKNFDNYKDHTTTVGPVPKEEDLKNNVIQITNTPYMDTEGNITWNKGDTVNITFDVEGLILINDSVNGEIWEPYNTFLVGKEITVQLLNNRGEVIYNNSYIQEIETNQIIFNVDSLNSSQIPTGNYTLKVWVKTVISEIEGIPKLVKELFKLQNSIIIK